MTADRPGTQVETWRDQIVGAFDPEHAEHGRAALDPLLAALDDAEQRAGGLESDLAHQSERRQFWRDKAEAAEQERDEWQQLATRLAEEAGVDAEAMLAQARAEEKS